MKFTLNAIVLICAAAAVATPALSAPYRGGAGGRPAMNGSMAGSRDVRSISKSSVVRSGNNRGGAWNNGGNRPGANRPNYNRPGNNTVIVNGGGYGGNRGGYYNNGRWENDDNDFGEFIGKTMAITAGAAVVASVANNNNNSRNNDNNNNNSDQNCTQQISNGQVYVNCNGTWYQPMQVGTQTSYEQVQAPR